ncbi:MAG: glycosyltransferase [Desulfobacula sp.]|uniref:glycosyltransferase n=1 Tax=Desulfobacula sp. TaxID=2593537 RepID=UPI0025BA2BA5|nr:glycosyltransferase [Desulfobacula sp.]MCD4722714.1 glycosyltransferase [Desulfobacula sp.]
MADLKYNYELDLENKDSSHTKILEMVGKGSYVLELGCASGYMTRYMKEELNCRVVCIEIDKDTAGLAAPFCEKMAIGDVEILDFKKIGLNNIYDIIIMADILEHLKDAKRLLVKLREYLSPEGFLLISIPNGAHGSVALEFLDGKVQYRDTGLLDNTHLHFFDKDNFTRMMDNAGYLVSHLDRVIVHPKDTELRTQWEKYPRQVTAYIEKVNPEFQTYQFIIKAFPATVDGWKKGLEDAARSQRQIRLDIESKMVSIQKDLDWHKKEIQRLNKELVEKEEKYHQVLSDEKSRLETEIHTLHKEYKIEIDRFNKEHNQTINLLNKEYKDDRTVYEDAVTRLETEMENVHSGYQAEIKRQQQEIKKRILSCETVKNDFQYIQAHAHIIQEQLDVIHHSLAWRMLQKYRSFIDKLMPENTKSRRCYRLSMLAPLVLFKEGPVSFANKIIKRLPGLPQKKDAVRYDLTFVQQDEIIISIVIPDYNKVEYTYKCLKSIVESSDTRLSYEVIVVDNASSDTTPKLLKETKGLVAIINKENKGFVEACNIGAGHAKGQYILFLNNDTEVTSHWLDKMLEPFKADEKVGITGAKLLYPDGSLQEAGNIIWQDATGWNYGRGDNPDLPEYSYKKEVDYCSGACLMIPKKLWEKAGGFDMRYAPAYYEDTDLCFTVRKMGYKVIFQPEAKVIHHEGVSAGTDINKGVKKFQQENNKKFLKKWKEILKSQHYEGPEKLFDARQRYSGKTILVVDHYAPTFDKDSGSLRMFSILKLLVSLGNKVIFWPENRAFNEYTKHLQRIGVEALYGNVRFEEYLQTNGQYLDLIIFSRPHVAINMIFSAKTYTNARIIYDTVDLHFLREQRKSRYDSNSDSHYWKKIEFFLADMADEILVVSDVEKKILEKEGYENKVSVITNVHENMGCKLPFEDRKGLLFIGGFFHSPNEDAMLWFIERIFPKIEQAIKGITCSIVGSHPTDAVRSLAGETVYVTGYIEDVTPYFENSRVFVSPLRYGAGVKGKIGQSLSFGLPVVTTSVGAEGMGCIDGQNILIAEDEDEFVQKVIKLYHDQQLWQKLSVNGMELIQERFSPEVIKKGLDSLLRSVN